MLSNLPYVPFCVLYNMLSFNERRRFRLAFPSDPNVKILSKSQRPKAPLFCFLCQATRVVDFYVQDYDPVMDHLGQAGGDLVHFLVDNMPILQTLTKLGMSRLNTPEFRTITDLEHHIITEHLPRSALSEHIENLPILRSDIVPAKKKVFTTAELQATAYTIKIFREIHYSNEQWPVAPHQAPGWSIPCTLPQFISFYIYLQHACLYEPAPGLYVHRFGVHNFLFFRMTENIIFGQSNIFNNGNHMGALFDDDNKSPTFSNPIKYFLLIN